MIINDAQPLQEAAIGVPISDMVGSAPEMFGPGISRSVMQMIGYNPEMKVGNGGFGLAAEAKPVAPTLDNFIKPSTPGMGA